MAPKSGSGRKLEDEQRSGESDFDYQQRRERNNVAVRKSREKSRARAKLTSERVVKLRRENDELESKIGSLSKELGLLKELLITRAGKKTLATAAGCNSKAESSSEVSSSSGIGYGIAADPSLVRQDHGYILIDRKFNLK